MIETSARKGKPNKTHNQPTQKTNKQQNRHPTMYMLFTRFAPGQELRFSPEEVAGHVTLTRAPMNGR